MVYNMCRFDEKKNSTTGLATDWGSGSLLRNKKYFPRLQKWNHIGKFDHTDMYND